jgi:arylsulfatase A-like enzyme
MNRPLKTLLNAIFLFLFMLPAFSYAQDEQRPNIVLIFADDLGYGDISICGSEIISTPNIDALAKNGVQCTQGYVSHPVCSPSRAGLLTGRYQQRHGWEFNPAGRDQDNGLSLDERTFADELKAAGYATGMVGKWHLGHQKPHHPLSRGFDEYFGVLAGASIFIDTSTPGVEAIGRNGKTRGPRNAVYRGFDEVKVDGYLTDVFTDEAVGFIDRHQDEPFFLYLSHTTPHTPLQATKQYLDQYRHIEDKRQRIFAAMVSSLDESVRRVVAKLKEIDEYDNTMIVFLSDNGCAGYVNGACTNAPYSGFKRYHQEGGTHVPFIVSWPNGLPKGTKYDNPVISLDLLATFTAAAGTPVATEDSVNLLPFLNGNNDGKPHEFLYWRSGPTKAIRGERWKLIKYNRTDLRPENLNAGGRLNPPQGGWSTDSPFGQITLLYDLEEDPGETTNLAKERPDIVDHLTAEYDEWAKELPEKALIPPIRSTLAEMHGEWVQLFF